MVMGCLGKPPTAEQGGTQHVPELQYKCMYQCHVQLDRPDPV